MADHSQDFIPYTNHRTVVAKIVYTNPSGTGRTTFPVYNPTFNKPCIKFPMHSEKHRHDNFRTLKDENLEAAALYDIEINDNESFLNVYNAFTKVLIPTSEEAYGCITHFTKQHAAQVTTPTIEKIIAHIRFLGGAICTIRDRNAPNLSHGACLVYNHLSTQFFDDHPAGQTFLQFATLEKRKLHRSLFTERVSEIKR